MRLAAFLMLNLRSDAAEAEVQLGVLRVATVYATHCRVRHLAPRPCGAAVAEMLPQVCREQARGHAASERALDALWRPMRRNVGGAAAA